MGKGEERSLQLPRFPSSNEILLPSFKPRGVGYESVYYGINSNILTFSVYRAYIERDTAIQKLQNLLRILHL